MPRQSKKIDADALVGEIALMRSSVWQNGRRKVAAIITEATTDTALLPEKAVALVSVTAFPIGAAPHVVQDVPLFSGDPESAAPHSAWLKPARA